VFCRRLGSFIAIGPRDSLFDVAPPTQTPAGEAQNLFSRESCFRRTIILCYFEDARCHTPSLVFPLNQVTVEIHMGLYKNGILSCRHKVQEQCQAQWYYYFFSLENPTVLNTTFYTTTWRLLRSRKKDVRCRHLRTLLSSLATRVVEPRVVWTRFSLHSPPSNITENPLSTRVELDTTRDKSSDEIKHESDSHRKKDSVLVGFFLDKILLDPNIFT
jgi:hypothetical protein